MTHFTQITANFVRLVFKKSAPCIKRSVIIKYDATNGKTLKWECVTVSFFKCNNNANNATNDDDDDDDDGNYL